MKSLLAGALGIALFELVTQSASIEAAVYKWVDEKGVTHYSETPPPKARSQEIKVQPPTSSAPESGTSAKSLQQQEAEFQARQRAREAQAAKEREALMAAEKSKLDLNTRCSIARSRIGALQAARRSQLDYERTRGRIATESSTRAFDEYGEELNALGKFADEKCPPEDLSAAKPSTRTR